ncbi:unnamed protein product [Rhizoctonia solani]|uniref:Arrestin C-terminal-like domain-containing protein n=1 Tax=Rhizoctonia solani TaxID=456999 RepID=A0A8H2W986_9AGAM|nr:unnamed protein product [Rhizoctonia solani]
MALPATCNNSTNPLPPSFKRSFPGSLAEVQYRVRVDMTRSGLRWRESDRTEPSVEIQGIEEIQLTPKSIQKSSKHSTLPINEVQAKITLPSPLVVASGDWIPFTITVHSKSQALAALYTDISLELVKVAVIRVPQRASSKEKVLASGEVYDSEQPGNGVCVLRGELGNGLPGAEFSWSIAETIEVRHEIRLSLKPPWCRIALSTNLPIFERTIPVEIMTHRYTLDSYVDMAFPALGLIDLN